MKMPANQRTIDILFGWVGGWIGERMGGWLGRVGIKSNSNPDLAWGLWLSLAKTLLPDLCVDGV